MSSGSASPARPSTSPRRLSPCSATTATGPTGGTPGSSTRSPTAGWPGYGRRSSAGLDGSSARPAGSGSRTRARGTAGRGAERRLGGDPGAPRRFEFTDTGDRYGWTEGPDGDSHFTLFIENGRVKDAAKAALREIARVHRGDFRLTPNQHLMIASIAPADRPRIEALLKEHNLDDPRRATGLRLNSMACVALPTCGLALAGSERCLSGPLNPLDAAGQAD